jgi:hypothetical protein
MIDVDQFLERAAIKEFDGGMSRYQAETEAAKAQGVPRWQALKAVQDANIGGNPRLGGDRGQAHVRHGSGAMPRVQPTQAQQVGSVSERDVHDGRRGGLLSPLRMEVRGVS